MPRRVYMGVQSVNRRVDRMYMGVQGVVREISRGYMGVQGAVRQYFPRLYFEERYNNPYPPSDMTNTYNVSYETGKIVLTQTSKMSKRLDQPRTRLEVLLRGLVEGDTVSCSYVYNETVSSMYIGGVLSFQGNGVSEKIQYNDANSDPDSGTINFTIPSGYDTAYFMIDSGDTSKSTQTLTITNLKVNGELVVPNF